jgi:hypothetical protein
MQNVVPLGSGHLPVHERVVEEIGYDDFCALLEGNAYLAKSEVSGLTILHYPRMMAICSGRGCTVIRQAGTNFDAYIDETLEILDAAA